MKDFSYPTYLEIKEGVERNVGSADENDPYSRENWYKKSYETFFKHPFEVPGDLIYFIAFAYAWMPKIPQVRVDTLVNNKELFQGLQNLKKESLTNETKEEILAKIMPVLIPNINNSLIGASKLLHFIHPQSCPILDERVIHVWNELFSPHYYIHTHATSPITKTSDYVMYRRNMLRWLRAVQKEDPRVTLRELEWTIFCY